MIKIAQVAKLSFQMQKTDIVKQNIDGFSLDIYNIVIAIFQLFNKLDYLHFFQKMFLFTDISKKVVFDMFF